MQTLKRNKRTLYWCKRDNSVDYEKYLEPIAVHFNYKATSREAEIVTTGEVKEVYYTIKDINPRIEPINIGDKLYLVKPDNYDFNDICNDADFIVTNKDSGLDIGELILKSLIGEVDW